MCVPYWWCTKHAQLIMGTWPIYKKHFLQLILTKKTFHLIKYLLATFIFFLSFQSVLVSFWSWSVYFSNFGTILTKWNGSNLGFPGISQRTHGGNGLKFSTLMYLDHLQNWLVSGHGQFIVLILALFWPSETDQIWGFRAFPGERMKELVWNFARWCILTIFRTDKFMATVFWFLLFWHYFDLVKWVKFGASGHILENALSEWPEIWYAAVSWPLSVLIRLWLRSGDFSNFGVIWLSETCQIWGFQACYAKPIEEMAWNFALTGQIMVTVFTGFSNFDAILT